MKYSQQPAAIVINDIAVSTTAIVLSVCCIGFDEDFSTDTNLAFNENDADIKQRRRPS